MPNAYAWQTVPPQARALAAETADTREGVDIPSPQQVYQSMIALKSQERYREGASWTNETHTYTWKGGNQDGIAPTGAGCVAFAYELSDAAFGALPARMLSTGQFGLSDVKAGDILRVNGGAHTVIVLQVTDAGVVIAEGNYHENGDYTGKVHWERSLSKAEVENAVSYITRYPENYTPPDDPSGGGLDGSGTLDGGLAWTLTKAGTLTISGSGAMPDFSSNQPWSAYADKILKISIENGVTKIGSGAFQGSKALSVEIPASVKEIGGGAFQSCSNLISVTIAGGVETIGDDAFRGCGKLPSISLPASVASVGNGVFMDCPELTQAVFASGGGQVRMGDNLFSRCRSLAQVTLPSSIDRIGVGMFTNCAALSAVAIPQGAVSIREQAFASCTRLKSVTIPDSVTEIGFGAFASCGVTDIYFGGSEAQWQSVSKLGDSNTALEKMTIHYNSNIPEPNPDPGPGDDDGGDDGGGPHTHAWNSGVITTAASCTSSGLRTYTCSGCGSTRTEAIPAKGHQLVLNDDGSYSCDNERGAGGESDLVVTAAIGEGYLEVKLRDGQKAPAAYQDAATAQRYIFGVVRAVLEAVDSRLSCTITTIRFTPPTQTVDGEYIYQVAIQSGGRAIALSLTTEPLRMVIPAGSAAVPDPAPKPDPEPDSSDDGDDEDWEETYSITVLKADGGKASANVRYAAQGDRVTVTVQPDDGYELSGLTVTDARGKSVAVQELGENRFRFTMPVARVEVSAVFTAAGTERPSPDEEDLRPLPLPFADVPASAWYYSSVEYVWRNRLMNGVSDTQFAPAQTTSRAMIWTILARMNGVSTDAAPGSTWYEKGMRWAMEQGVSDGSSPMEDITREQLAVMLWRNAGSPEGSGSLDSFRDAGSASGYAAGALRWAVGCGILQGNGGYLNPKGTAARTEAAAMLMRYASR